MIHTIIKVESRTGSRANSIAIDASTRNAQGQVVTPKTQLHSMGESVTDQSNLDYAAKWDGIALYVAVPFLIAVLVLLVGCASFGPLKGSGEPTMPPGGYIQLCRDMPDYAGCPK